MACVEQAVHCWGWGNTNVDAILIAVRFFLILVPGDAEITREMSLLLGEDATVGSLMRLMSTECRNGGSEVAIDCKLVQDDNSVCGLDQ